MVPKGVFCLTNSHFKQQPEILPANFKRFDSGLKKVFFHRRLRSNITHLAHHLENLPIPLISFAKKHSSPKGDSDLLFCGRWRRPKKQQVRIFSDPLDFSVFEQNTSTIRPCERSIFCHFLSFTVTFCQCLSFSVTFCNLL